MPKFINGRKEARAKRNEKRKNTNFKIKTNFFFDSAMFSSEKLGYSQCDLCDISEKYTIFGEKLILMGHISIV